MEDPSIMRKRIALTIAAVLGLALACQAQFIGYVTPQSVLANLAIGASCTGSTQTYTTGVTPGFSNLGQTQHAIVLTAGSSLLGVSAQILGSNDGTNFVVIGDTLTSVNGIITASGYYAQIRVTVTCSTGIYSLTYSGTSAAPAPVAGASILQLVDKNIAVGRAANTTFTTFALNSPFANSNGSLVFVYGASAGPAGSTLTVNCITVASQPAAATWGPYLLAATTAVQVFPVPAAPCPLFTVTYTSGGASAFSYTLDYAFNVPGQSALGYRYQNITTNASTQLKTGSGFLHSVTVNNPGTTETLAIFDNTACSGTAIATTGSLAAAQVTLLYDIQFNAGLCIISAGAAAGNFTVSFQ
jgi:hypothetical protein